MSEREMKNGIKICQDNDATCGSHVGGSMAHSGAATPFISIFLYSISIKIAIQCETTGTTRFSSFRKEIRTVEENSNQL